MTYTEAMETTTRVIEVAGVAVIVVGLALGFALGARDLVSGTRRTSAFATARSAIGRSILLGLEILVAADIIRTVAVEPSLQNVGVLALIVLIRTFLSFSLEIEIDGPLPWRRAVPPQR